MNYENELETVLSELDVSELDGLINDIELPHNRKAGKIIAEKTARKERITMKKNISKRSVAAIAAIAAALAMTVTAGAAVYKTFFHKESAEKFGIVNENNSELVIGTTSSENAHLRVTADTVLSDGLKAEIIFTIEALDSEGQEYLDAKDNHGISIPLMYFSKDIEIAYTKNLPKNDPGTTTLPMAESRKISDNTVAYKYTIFFNNDNPGVVYIVPKKQIYGETEPTGSKYSIFDGICLKIDLSKNIEIRELTNGDDKLYLTRIGTMIIEGENSDFDNPDAQYKYELVYKDGTKKALKENNAHTTRAKGNKGYSYLFEQIDDIDNVTSVIYNGKEYK